MGISSCFHSPIYKSIQVLLLLSFISICYADEDSVGDETKCGKDNENGRWVIKKCVSNKTRQKEDEQLFCRVSLLTHHLTHCSLAENHYCIYRDLQYIVRVSYEQIFNILVFLFATYVAGLVTKAIGMPALVGEIVTGFLVRSLMYTFTLMGLSFKLLPELNTNLILVIFMQSL